MTEEQKQKQKPESTNLALLELLVKPIVEDLRKQADTLEGIYK